MSLADARRTVKMLDPTYARGIVTGRFTSETRRTIWHGAAARLIEEAHSILGVNGN